VKRHTPEDVVNRILEYTDGTSILLLASFHIAINRTLKKQLEMYMQEGYSRVFINQEITRIEDVLNNAQQLQQPAEDFFLVISRIRVDHTKDTRTRITDAAETAFYEGNGNLRISIQPSNISFDFSTRFEADGITFEEPNDNMFSFNSPLGACPTCEGFGTIIGIDEKLVIPNTSLSIYEGCVQCWHGERMGMWQSEFIRRAAQDNFPIFEPYYKLDKKYKRMLWHGLDCEKGLDIHEKICIDAFFHMVKENQYKIQYRVMLSRYRGKTICPDCQGMRLKKEATWVKVNGKSITELVEMPVSLLKNWFDHLKLSPQEADISKRLVTEIQNRLKYLFEVGLGYLTLNRPSNTLSGGESQRINLTTSLGSSLVGSLYILDEPSIGLHSRDTDRLIHVLRELQEVGNTVIVVEHDEEIMRAADYLIDIGPDAGNLGGNIVFQGNTELLSKQSANKLIADYPHSYTIKYLTHAETIAVPASRRSWNQSIVLKGARMNNLKGIDVIIPLNVFTCVTGVSGSGKSSLIKGILYPALKRQLDEVADIPGEFTALEGDVKAIKHIEFVDQNPIGRSTRSNPATYVKAYEAIRQLFAEQPLAKQMGFTPQYFSFNTEGGRCEECKGAGVINVEMQFMADLVLECESCHGQRFKRDILEVKFHNKDICDILNMTVSEAINFFNTHKQKTIVNRLRPLEDVGLGYIKLGQNSSTLSGGENQRVKLAYFIGQEKQEPTLFIFDEPTTGLHFHDIQRLLTAFYALIERGHTILVIEHNLDVIKCADYVIDLGPDGGDKGGELVFQGTPEALIGCKHSITAKFLKEKL